MGITMGCNIMSGMNGNKIRREQIMEKMMFWKKLLVVLLPVSVLVQVTGCVGVKTANPYVSPKQTFAIYLPLSPHPYRITETTNSAHCIEQVAYEDTYGLQMGVLVTKARSDINQDEFVQNVFSNVPSEVKEEGQIRKMGKDIIPSKFGKMVILKKGPYKTKTGYVYAVTGIFPFQGLIYDFYATCYPYCETPETAETYGVDQFSQFFGNLVVYGEKGRAGSETNKDKAN